jgi:chromosome condensin MukBEF MukE localization factor
MPLKSAWELALERTGGASAAKLTDAQKTKLAELDKLYTAKIAQEDLTLKPKIAEAHAAGEDEKAQKLEEQLQTVLGRLRRKLESEKDAVRKSP